MNIALITYHYSSNHGAVMQAYATCRYLKELGHSVQIIDIRQDESGNQPFYVKFLKFFIYGYRMNKFVRKHYPPLTKRYYCVSELQNDPPHADCYIVGSDQTWNPNISRDLVLAYFLDFGDKNVRRISYASSFGTTRWELKDPLLTSRIAKLLKRFTSVSVREEQGREICLKTFGLDAEVVLDPVFLNDGYPEFVPKVYEGKELVCYKTNRTEDFWNNIGRVGKEMGVKPTLMCYNYPKRGFKYCFPPSLSTFLNKLATAKFIITDSFHGIAFSIIFRKQFVAILNEDGKNSRLINLMKVMGLDDRIYNSVEEMCNDDAWKVPIDYQTKEKIISKQVEYSRNYLLHALCANNNI